MRRYTLRPKAEEDLVQHEEYLAENASVETASRFLDAVEESLRLLARNRRWKPSAPTDGPNSRVSGCGRFEVLRTTSPSTSRLTTASMSRGCSTPHGASSVSVWGVSPSPVPKVPTLSARLGVQGVSHEPDTATPLTALLVQCCSLVVWRRKVVFQNSEGISRDP